MREYRFYVPLDNVKDDLVTINGDENNHLFRVLRLSVGDKVTILCNDGLIRDCELIKVDKNNSIAKIIDKMFVDTSFANVTLFQALIKADKMDLIVQKCTELGIKSIVPFESEYCTVVDKGNKQDRLNRIALSSCKQCGRVNSIEIKETMSFDSMLSVLKEYDKIIFAYENIDNNAFEVLTNLTNKDKIAIIVGCEGGFSLSEAQQIIDIGAKAISMGRLILRAETAAIALSSVVMYSIGEWKR